MAGQPLGDFFCPPLPVVSVIPAEENLQQIARFLRFGVIGCPGNVQQQRQLDPIGPVQQIGQENFGNVIGGGDWAEDRLIPDWVRAAEELEKLAGGLLDGRPATLSPVVIDRAIRGHIGFDGLLMSDDLGMRALSGSFRARAEAVVGELSAALNLRASLFLATKVWTHGRDAGIGALPTTLAEALEEIGRAHV